jgi:glycosyltransferase involved in cell wall biosynthesis
MNILVIALLKDSQLKYKLEPLAMSPGVDRLYLLRKSKGPQIPKLEYLVLPGVCRWRPFYLILAPLYAIYFSLTKKADWILAYHLVPHGIFAFIVSLATGKPYVYSQIDQDIEHYARHGVLKKLILLFLRKAAYINVPGSHSKRFWTGLGIAPDKINILHSSIDTENAFYHVPQEKEYDFVYVGELEPRKQVHLIIDAANRLVASGHDVKLAIIGDGPTREPLERQARGLGVSSNIRFLGWQTDIRHFLNRSKIFVLISSNEGLPCALMEAMACELLVVASKVADIPDIVIDGETGFLISDSSPDSVFHVLEEAFLHYEDCALMRRKAREKIVSGHSYDAAREKWGVFLKKIAAGGGK